MRPDPRNPTPPDESGRIIYLGDVRRRRTYARQQSGFQYLGALGLLAVLAWMVWLAVLLTVAPVRLVTYLAFFVPLAVALAASAAIGAFLIDWRRGAIPSLGRAARRGTLTAMVLILSLSLLAAHHWSIVVLIVSLGGAVLLDAGLTMRRR